MTATGTVLRGRESFESQAWDAAYAELSAADRESPLGADDLTLLATAAHLSGDERACAAAMERAHQEFLRDGEPAKAAMCAFWLALPLLMHGKTAQAGGWLARARRLLEPEKLDCVEYGYVLIPEALRAIFAGDFAGANARFGQVVEIGDRFGDLSLVTYGRHGQGRALLRLGETTDGLALIDEAMVAVTTGEVSPVLAGIVYCSVIEACQETFDLRRAQEWTDALTDWCAGQSGLVPYRGQCLVHRSQIMQLHGEWPNAVAEAVRARERLSGHGVQGMACYQLAELHRLLGEFDLAEQAYREASGCGHSTQPGLAQLRLAQGNVTAAESAIRQALDEATTPVERSRLLAGYVEIMLATGDHAAARTAATELARLAEEIDAQLLSAMSGQANGAVLVAEGKPAAAVDVLRSAQGTWEELDAPYEVARVRALIGCARRQLGDDDTAQLEFDAAARAFRSLGATPALAWLGELSSREPAHADGGLTGRERQVLSLAASGRTNRQIATELVISEHTVRRHMQNIFTKIGVSSRAAAAAYAFRHRLL